MPGKITPSNNSRRYLAAQKLACQKGGLEIRDLLALPATWFLPDHKHIFLTGPTDFSC